MTSITTTPSDVTTIAAATTTNTTIAGYLYVAYTCWLQGQAVSHIGLVSKGKGKVHCNKQGYNCMYLGNLQFQAPVFCYNKTEI